MEKLNIYQKFLWICINKLIWFSRINVIIIIRFLQSYESFINKNANLFFSFFFYTKSSLLIYILRLKVNFFNRILLFSKLKVLRFKNEHCHLGKHSKQLLTFSFAIHKIWKIEDYWHWKDTETLLFIIFTGWLLCKEKGI